MKAWSSLLRAFLQCASWTALSRVMGLVRDIVCAHYLGASVAFDAFLVAFQIPNFFRRLFAEGAMSQAFVPVYADVHQNQSPRVQRQFLSGAMGSLLSLLVVITLVVCWFSPWVIRLYAPGFEVFGPRYELAVHLLRLTFPYLCLISLTAFYSAILNSLNRFSLVASLPVILNLCLIVGIVCGHYFQQPAWGLGLAVPVAGLLQLLIAGFHLIKVSGFFMPHWGWCNPHVRQMWRLMIGALFGVSIAQLGLIMDTFLASFLVKGSVSWLYFSQRLVFLPLGLFAVAAATVILPKLSANQQQRADIVQWATALVCMIALPATVGLILLAKPILLTLFHYGAFSLNDVMMSRQSLIMLAIGLPAFMLNKVLVSCFYAQKNVRTPVKFGVLALLVNLIVALITMKMLAHAGLAFASASAGWVQCGLLSRQLVKQGLWRVRNLGLLKLCLAVVIMMLIMISVMPKVAWMFNAQVWLRVAGLVIMVSLGLVTYLSSLKLLKWQLPRMA